MSAECERIFSRAKQVVTTERNRIKPSTIQANECQKDWLCKGLVKSYLNRAEQEELRYIRDHRDPNVHESLETSQMEIESRFEAVQEQEALEGFKISETEVESSGSLYEEQEVDILSDELVLGKFTELHQEFLLIYPFRKYRALVLAPTLKNT